MVTEKWALETDKAVASLQATVTLQADYIAELETKLKVSQKKRLKLKEDNEDYDRRIQYEINKLKRGL